MSNKIKKKIECGFCEKTVPYTNECHELLGVDVCPDCTMALTRLVNKLMVENDTKEVIVDGEQKKGDVDICE